MAISLTEFSHETGPVTSTPNKTAADISTSELANGGVSTNLDDELNEMHLPPASSPSVECQHTSSSLLEPSKDDILSDPKQENTGDENTSNLFEASPNLLHQGATTDSGGKKERDLNLTDYICHQHTADSNEVSSTLRERLLLALTRLIPHRESLSLRLLVNYTVDGDDSECLVIDETLRRRSGTENHGKEQLQGEKDVIKKMNEDQPDPVYNCEPENKRRRLHQLLYKDSPALDLSLPVEKINEAMQRIMNKLENKVSIEPRNVSAEVPNEGLQTTVHLPNGPGNVSHTDNSIRQVISTGTGILNGNLNGPSTSAVIPLLDPSVISLLPLLQQQKQKPSQPVLNPINLSGIGDNTFPNSLLMPPDTSTENLLIKELQTLVQNTSNANTANNDGRANERANANGNTFGSIYPSINNITTTLIKQCEKSNETVGASSSGVTGAGMVNNTVNSTNNSVLNLPLLNAFSADQLCALFPQSPFIGQSATGNPSTGAISSGNTNNIPSLLSNLQQQQQQNTINPVNNFASFNIGSATLLNLRDKLTGLETLGIMPATGSKSLSQPVTNLLNHFNQNSGPTLTPSPVSSASVSFRALSSLSQLFNSVANTSMISTLPQPSSSLLAGTPTPTAMAATPASSTGASSMNFSQPQTALLPAGLNAAASSMGTTPTTMLTMLPHVFPSTDVVAMLNSFSGTGPVDKNRLVTLDSLTAAVDRIKRQLPGSRPPSTNLNNSDVNMQTTLTSGAKSDASRLVSSPGSSGEAFESSSPSTNNLMFGRRLLNTRRFICNQCRRNYTSLAELNRHTLDAHNSFKCTICSAHFTQRSNLQRHSLKHVGFKPFTCNLCKKEYYRKDHLVRHIEVTHPNHDPKMNITVHLTSSECLEYLDRINTGKQTPSPGGSEIQIPSDLDMAEEDLSKVAEDTTEETGVSCNEAAATLKLESLTPDESLSQTP